VSLGHRLLFGCSEAPGRQTHRSLALFSWTVEGLDVWRMLALSVVYRAH